MIISSQELQRDFLARAVQAPIWRLGSVEPPHLRAAVAIGAFDGVHIGHRDLIERTCEDAVSRGLSSVVVTFDPDPDEVVSSSPALKLMSVDDRLRCLSQTGVDGVLVVPFTSKIAGLGFEDFFRSVVFPALHVESVHVGANFRLGAGARSDVLSMRPWLADHGVDLYDHRLVTDEGSCVSATRIRSLVSDGDLEGASKELGRRYMLSGIVSRGRGQGSGMGFPTANVALGPLAQLPRRGVWAALARTERGEVYPAAVNVGVPPMFEHEAHVSRLEVNLLGYSGDLYGQRLSVVFVSYLRASVRFGSVDELIHAVNHDIACVASLLGEGKIEMDE